MLRKCYGSVTGSSWKELNIRSYKYMFKPKWEQPLLPRGLRTHRYHCFALRGFNVSQPSKPSQPSQPLFPRGLRTHRYNCFTLKGFKESQPSKSSQPSQPLFPSGLTHLSFALISMKIIVNFLCGFRSYTFYFR